MESKKVKFMIIVLASLLIISLIALASVLMKFYFIPPQTVTDSVADNMINEIGKIQ